LINLIKYAISKCRDQTKRRGKLFASLAIETFSSDTPKVAIAASIEI
jgi:hypothetical protein